MLKIIFLEKVRGLYSKSKVDNEHKELMIKTVKEIWKNIKDYEGLYQVSNLGRVKRIARYSYDFKYLPTKIMKTTIKNGNVIVGLVKDKKTKTYTLSRLVYKTFNPDFNEKDRSYIVLQKDGNKLNNAYDNLYVERRKIVCKLISASKEPVICVSTGKYFDSIEDASKYYKIFATHISKCCKRKLESTGKIVLDNGIEIKLIWRYLSDEIWKNIVNYEGLYQVSNFGRVKSLERYTIKNRLIKAQIKNKTIINSVLSVRLSKYGNKKYYSIARVVYKAFNPKFNDKNLSLEVRHKDKNSLNNELSNLYIESKSIWQDHKVKFFCTTTKTLFNSLNEAKEYANLKSGTGIVLCCQKKRKHSGKLEDGTKLKWKYIKDNLKY